MKCDKCYSARWLYAESGFDDSKKLTSTWRPFSRDFWQGLGKPVISALLATKCLRNCDCNPDRLAPWAKVFSDKQAQPAGAADDTPF